MGNVLHIDLFFWRRSLVSMLKESLLLVRSNQLSNHKSFYRNEALERQNNCWDILWAGTETLFCVLDHEQLSLRKNMLLWKLLDNMEKIFWFWHIKILQFSSHWTFTHGCYFHQLQIIFISILFQTISLWNWANPSFNINIFLSVHLYRLTHFEQILWDHENQWLMKIHGE